MTSLPIKAIGNAVATIPIPRHHADAWFMSSQKRICAPIPESSAKLDECESTYKIRAVVERDLNIINIKDNLCLAGRRTQNEKTLHADLILTGITQLVTVVLADKIHHHEYIRSLTPLIS